MTLVVFLRVKPGTAHVVWTGSKHNTLLPRAKMENVRIEDIAQNSSKPWPRVKERLDTYLAVAVGVVLEVRDNPSEGTNSEYFMLDSTEVSIEGRKHAWVSNSDVHNTSRGGGDIGHVLMVGDCKDAPISWLASCKCEGNQRMVALCNNGTVSLEDVEHFYIERGISKWSPPDRYGKNAFQNLRISQSSRTDNVWSVTIKVGAWIHTRMGLALRGGVNDIMNAQVQVKAKGTHPETS